MNLILCKVLKSVEKRSVQSSYYGLDVMKSSCSKIMYRCCTAILIKVILVLQNYTNSEKVLVGPYGEMYPASYDANHTMNIKTEEDSDAQEEVDPVRITVQKIKAELEVSCVFLYVHC
jgi:hypothetical protein